MLAGMRLLATDLDGTLVFHHAVGQALVYHQFGIAV